MKKNIKTYTIAGLILLIIGAVLVGGGLAMDGSLGVYYDRGFKVIDPGYNQTENTDLSAIKSIDIDIRLGEVRILAGDSYHIDITNYYEDNIISYTVENGTLLVTDPKRPIWHFGLFFDLFSDHSRTNRVDIYLPRSAALESLSGVLGAGDLEMQDITAREVSLHCDLGDLRISGLNADRAHLNLSAGSSTVTGGEVENLVYDNDFGKGIFEDMRIVNLEASLSAGDLSLTRVFVGASDIKNNFGAVYMKEVRSEGMVLELDAGRADLEGDFLGENIISSNFGEVRIAAEAAESDYNFSLSTDFGSVSLNGRKFMGELIRGAKNSLKVDCSAGSINITTR